jgi:hypothetical protein
MSKPLGWVIILLSFMALGIIAIIFLLAALYLGPGGLSSFIHSSINTPIPVVFPSP